MYIYIYIYIYIFEGVCVTTVICNTRACGCGFGAAVFPPLCPNNSNCSKNNGTLILMHPYRGFGHSGRKMRPKFHRFRCYGNREPSGALRTSQGGPNGLQGPSWGAQKSRRSPQGCPFRAGSHLIYLLTY